MSESNTVRLTVQTLSGSFSEEFGVNQKLQDVIEKTFLTLDIKPTPGDKWELRYENTVLDPQTTIKCNKIPDGSTLTLAPEEGGGGLR